MLSLHIFVTKLSGNTNPQYATSLLYLSLSLASSGSKKFYEFVAVNLDLMPPCYYRIVFAKRHIYPFINLATTVTVEKL